MRLFPKKACKKHWKQELTAIAQNKTETCTMRLFDSQILFCKRTGSVGVNAIKHYLKRLWLVTIATILRKTLKIHFLFMSAIAHNWSFFTKFKQTFWSIYRVPFHLNINAGFFFVTVIMAVELSTRGRRADLVINSNQRQLYLVITVITDFQNTNICP